jgi:hypothetical protein
MAIKGTLYKEQVIRILKEVNNGISVSEVCRKCGMTDAIQVYQRKNRSC